MTAADALRHCLPGWAIVTISARSATAQNGDWIFSLRSDGDKWTADAFLEGPTGNDIAVAGV